jgi:hypothetical protein
MSSLTIKLFDKAYVGFVNRHTESGAPLGFLTPYGTDSAAQKRMATIDSWVTRNKSSLKAVVIDNTPVSGFRIADAARRGGWRSTKQTMIRIEDPRGFELEISVENMVRIMSENTVINGEIMVPCMWGRDGTENVLLPTTSEPYQDAIKNTEREKQSVNLRSVKPGYRVELKDGRIGTYYGSFHVLNLTHHGRYEDDGINSRFFRRNEKYSESYHFVIDSKKTYVVNIEPHGTSKNSYIEKSRTLKVARILESNELTTAEAEKKINEHLLNKSRGFYYDSAMLAGTEYDLRIVLKPHSISEIQETVKKNQYSHRDRYVVQMPDGQHALISPYAVKDLGTCNRQNGFGYVRDANDLNIYAQKVDLVTFSTGSFTLRRSNYSDFEKDDQIVKALEQDLLGVFKPMVEITSKKTGEVIKTQL